MSLPLQVTFRQMDPSPALEERIRTLVSRLGKLSPRITSCHVIVEIPHRHHSQGKLFQVRIDLAIPGQQIAINKTRPGDPSHEDVYAALRDAFQAARRKLRELERIRQQPVRSSVIEAQQLTVSP